MLNYAPGTSPRLLRRHSAWPSDRRHHPIQQFPDTTSLPCVRALQPNPDPPGSSWWFRLEGRSAAGSTFVTSLRLACRTRTIWQCWPVPALSGLSPPSRESRCPQLQPARCDELETVSFHHRFESASWRSMSVTHNDPARCGRSRDRRGRPMSACHDVSCVDGFLVGPRSRPVS